MYILVVEHDDDETEYFGPFPTEDRARLYADDIKQEMRPKYIGLETLIVPCLWNSNQAN